MVSLSEHPIEGLMNTAMNSIKDMIDVDTVIGDPIQVSNNTTIIPISKVCFGFAAGGSEFKGETIDEYSKKEKEEEIQYRLPFGGGSGAGVNLNPVAFLVIQSNNVKLLPVNHASCLDKLLDYIPDLIEKTNSVINKNMQNKKEEKQDERKIKKENIENEIKKNKVKMETVRPNYKSERKQEQVSNLNNIMKKTNNIEDDYEVEYVEEEPGKINFEDYDQYDD